MASIIPPEFFGLTGLGQSLQQFGQDRERKREVKRRRSAEDFQQGLTELQAIANTGDMEEYRRRAAELFGGDVDQIQLPPEMIQQNLANEAFRTYQSDPSQLTPVHMQILSGQPLTPQQAARMSEAQVQGAELDVDVGRVQLTREELARDADRRQARVSQDRDAALEALGLNEGWLQAQMGMYEVEQAGANVDLTKTQTRRYLADIRRIDLEIAQLQTPENPLDEMTREYIRNMAAETGMNPAVIAQMSGYVENQLPEDIQEEARRRMEEVVASKREGLLAETRKSRQAGNMDALIFETALENPERFEWTQDDFIRNFHSVLDSVSPGEFEIETRTRAANGFWGFIGQTVDEERITRRNSAPLDPNSLQQQVEQAVEMHGDQAAERWNVEAASQVMPREQAEMIKTTLERAVEMTFGSRTETPASTPTEPPAREQESTSAPSPNLSSAQQGRIEQLQRRIRTNEQRIARIQSGDVNSDIPADIAEANLRRRIDRDRQQIEQILTRTGMSPEETRRFQQQFLEQAGVR